MFCNKCGAIIEQPKNKTVPILIAVIVVLVIAVATLAVLLILKNNKNECNTNNNGQAANQETTTTTTEDLFYRSNKNPIKAIDFKDVKGKPEDEKEASKNIEYVTAFFEQSSTPEYAYAYLVLNNKNTSGMYDITAYINYYKDGQRIGSDQTTSYSVLANQRFVMSISLHYYESYDSIDITYVTNKSKSTYEEIPIDQSKIKINKVSGKIVAQYPEKPTNKTSFWAGIVYYKDGKMVYAHDDTASIYDNEEEAEFTFFPPKDIPYDNYEINIYSAHKSLDY